ncbi:hypothetical protein DV736_g2405, partial [Chaetothyriales sp. CBS 134916]
MDVELYVYDLSGGLARQYSQALIGQHIDAVYHTAIVVNNIEFFFGQGIHRKIPGSTHHGRPIKIVNLGKTHLNPETIEEYVQSLEPVYTPESYDLFLHNCNNFSQDLSLFLVGKSIPEEITSLPETFLRTPIGQMLRGQIDQSMRTMVQAPDAVSGTNVPRRPTAHEAVNNVAKPTANGSVMQPFQPAEFSNGCPPPHQPGQVWNISELSVLSKLLKQAEGTCAAIFFTSSTCAPCKICYAPYDELAKEAGSKATLIKVDISHAYEICSRYGVRATPTFMTFVNGQKYEEWSGADVSRLRGSVQMLVQMTQPSHAHFRLKTPGFHGLIRKPIMYTKIPPLDKLAAKLGPFAQDSSIRDLIAFISAHTASSGGGAANAALPNLPSLSTYLSTIYKTIPLASRFALVDLIRVAAIDSRVSSFLATEPSLRTLSILLAHTDGGWGSAPFQLRLVTCQLVCNLFSSPVFQDLVSQPSSTLRTYLESMSDCLIAPDNANARSTAAALSYNLAAINHNERVQGRPDKFDISEDVEAALASAVFNEHESKESLRSQLLALGLLLYAVKQPRESTVWQLCESLELNECLKTKAKDPVFKGSEGVLREVSKDNGISAGEEAEIKSAWSLFKVDDAEGYEDQKEGVIETENAGGGAATKHSAQGLGTKSKQDLDEFVEILDPEGDGYVTYAHFVELCALQLKNKSDETRDEEVGDDVLKAMILEANGGQGVARGVDVQHFREVMMRAGVFE